MNLDPLFLNPQTLLTITVIIFFYSIAINSTIRRLLLLSGSIYFYLKFAGTIELLIITLLTLITFYAGKLRNRFVILMGISVNIIALIISKIYIARYSSQSSDLKFWIPLGISFFVFEFIHYLIEIRRGMNPEENLFQFLTFGFYFPTVVSGPIRRYRDFSAQTLILKRIELEDFMTGIFLVGLGYIYKFGADQFANFQDKMHYFQTYAGLKGGIVFLFVTSMHIFLDFAGYSYIAIGISRIFGIKIPRNFNAPYLATSLINFWDRWHISLSSWVRDYLYIPLGGSRVNFLRQSTNLLISMVVIGLWHGLGFQFLVWGFMQGCGLVVNHLIRRVIPASPSKELRIVSTGTRWLGTIIFVSCSWIFFFYPPMDALNILKAILRGFLI